MAGVKGQGVNGDDGEVIPPCPVSLPERREVKRTDKFNLPLFLLCIQSLKVLQSHGEASERADNWPPFQSVVVGLTGDNHVNHNVHEYKDNLDSAVPHFDKAKGA